MSVNGRGDLGGWAEDSRPEEPDETAVLDALSDGPAWSLIPESVTVADGVDLGAVDPADDDPDRSWRRCVGARRDGHRCGGRALDDGLLCPIHEGRADPQTAAAASHDATRTRKEAAAMRVAMMRLGTRAVVAQALADEALNIRAAVQHLARRAADGDRQCALALLPFIDQALGRPTERVEQVQATSVEALEHMDTSALEALVLQGRARRLQAVDSAGSAA